VYLYPLCTFLRGAVGDSPAQAILAPAKKARGAEEKGEVGDEEVGMEDVVAGDEVDGVVGDKAYVLVPVCVDGDMLPEGAAEPHEEKEAELNEEIEEMYVPQMYIPPEEREGREADACMLSAYNRCALDVMKKVEVTQVGVMLSVWDFQFLEKYVARLEAQEAEASLSLEKMRIRARSNREMVKADILYLADRIIVPGGGERQQRIQLDMDERAYAVAESRLQLELGEINVLEAIQGRTKDTLELLAGRAKAGLRFLEETEEKAVEMKASVTEFSSMVQGSNPEWVVAKEEGHQLTDKYHAMRME
jgi:hypothetical protein